jgi:predicted transglutaminase-like cysteine proteinase
VGAVFSKSARGLGLCFGLLAGTAALASSDDRFMTIGPATAQPVGHYDFCRRHNRECRIKTARDVRVRLTEALWKQLVAVNVQVNRTIKPATDLATWGHDEFWEYPTRQGDCDDFMLEKRRALIRKGWPVGALLMTVVQQSDGEGHAVLTVLTDRGDFILDNLDDGVALWSATEYAFVKRQSEYDSGAWVAIDDSHLQLVGSIAR